MPEGDTLRWTAHRLHAALHGAEITRSDLRWPSLAGADLRGDVTSEVVAVGKHLLHRFASGRTLHSHLKMEGTWRVRPAQPAPRAERDPAARVLLCTSGVVAVGRRLGALDLLDTRDEHRVVGHLGPDVLDPDVTLETLTDRLRGDPRPVAEVLLDQTVVCGIGTFWASECCFLAARSAWTPADRWDASFDEALARVRRLMARAATDGRQVTTGDPRPGHASYVHGRSGRPCRRCGDTCRVAAAGPAGRERTIFYCPTCQAGLAPTDDGRPQRPLGASGVRRPYRG